MSIRYSIGESGQFLTLEQNVLDYFVGWRQLDKKMPEAGGQLFGVVEGQCIKVKLATEAFRSTRTLLFYRGPSFGTSGDQRVAQIWAALFRRLAHSPAIHSYPFWN